MSDGRGFYVNISVPKLDKTLAEISAFDGKSRLVVERVIKNATRRTATRARQRAPVDRGKLRKSITTSFKTRTLVGIVKVKTPYAHLIEFGAKGGYKIKPKNGKALYINANGVGRYAAHTVNSIPARKARPFLIPSYNEVAPDIVPEIKKGLEAIKK